MSSPYLAVATSSASDEWSTPRSLVRQLADDFGPFTGDGAALMQACPELYGPN